MLNLYREPIEFEKNCELLKLYRYEKKVNFRPIIFPITLTRKIAFFKNLLFF